MLVTGGTRGMGEQIARRFILGGARVATTARSSRPTEQAPTLFIQADVGTSDGVKTVVDVINKEWGGIDILVNCVGGSDAPNGGFQALTDEHWQKALDVNLLAAVRFDRRLLPGMLERRSGSSCTSLRSSIGCRFMNRHLPYAAAKGALRHLQQRPCERSRSERCESEPGSHRALSRPPAPTG